MQALVPLLIALLLGGVAFMIVAKVVPGFRLRGGFWDAIIVALVYGVLKAVLQKALIALSMPFVLISMGVFIIIINAFLLWLTDKLMHRLQIRSLGALLIGTILLSVIDYGFQLLFRHGPIF
ncbi:phage holin family protein [Haliangium sp.]|uniref:phage holin family protein n=1 Tax=Haliangium sp. TaxID=2663208 RepID=UPI003D115247